MSGGICMSDTILSIEEKNKQRKIRINRIKKIMIGIILFAVLFPTILCLGLIFKMFSLQKQVDKLNESLKNKIESSETTNSSDTLDLSDGVYATELPKDVQVKAVASDNVKAMMNKEPTKTIAYLTFDDGPSENTAQILDILKEYNIKASFFVVGKETDEAKELYKRIVDEGHTLGMHSYSHQYSDIYKSVDSFAKDEKKLSDLLYETTGVIPTLYRFPGGSNNLVSNIDMTEFIEYLNSQHITYFDWNVASKDGTSQNVDADTLAYNVLHDVEKYETSIILMHDATEKTTTIEALSEIIEGLQNLGIEMRPLDENVAHIQNIGAKTVDN